MGRKIGFTYDIKEDYPDHEGSTEDAFAEFDAEETVDFVRDTIESGGHKVIKIGGARELLRRINDLDVDIVFNICEGFRTRNRESEVPVILDLYGIPYIGSDGLTLGLTLDKLMAKKAFIADNIPTPKYFVSYNGNGCKSIAGMKYPLIVKPRCEGSSKGISEKSIVTNRKDLIKQIEEIEEMYSQPALVEEFVSGKEFTVLVIGNEVPEALPPVQIQILGKLDLGDMIYTSRRVLTTEVEYICPPHITKAQDKKMRELAIKAYKSVDCRDFGRVDFRVDKKGKPYVLEVNPLPSFSVEDVFPMTAEAHGIDYKKLVLKIIDFGLKRYGLN